MKMPKLITKLANVQKGYTEIYFYTDDNADVVLAEGWVGIKQIHDWTDFEKDEYHYKTRWLAHMKYGSTGHYHTTGKMTGYPTRNLAVQACEEEAQRIFTEMYKKE